MTEICSKNGKREGNNQKSFRLKIKNPQKIENKAKKDLKEK